MIVTAVCLFLFGVGVIGLSTNLLGPEYRGSDPPVQWPPWGSQPESDAESETGSVSSDPGLT